MSTLTFLNLARTGAVYYESKDSRVHRRGALHTLWKLGTPLAAEDSSQGALLRRQSSGIVLDRSRPRHQRWKVVASVPMDP